MSTVADLDISKYKCYFFTEKIEDFSLIKVLPSGEQEYTDYDKYPLENGTLICFTEYEDNQGNCELYLKTSDDTEIIQNITYETFFGNIQRWDNTESFYYIYGNSVDITNAVTEKFSEIGEFNPLGNDRCGYGEYSFRIFFVSDGIQKFTVDLQKQTRENIEYANVLLHISKLASIMVISHKTETPTHTWPVHTIVAKTFYGILKNIIEWSEVTEEPWNNTELPAVKARPFLDSLSLTDDLISEVETRQNDMAVKKFISDTENARVSDELVLSMSDSLKSNLSNKFKFKTLNNLVKYKNINISQEILDKELEKIEQNLYLFCSLNNISINDFESKFYSNAGELSFDHTTSIVIENEFLKFKTIKES